MDALFAILSLLLNLSDVAQSVERNHPRPPAIERQEPVDAPDHSAQTLSPRD